jgi:hypothetical protein
MVTLDIFAHAHTPSTPPPAWRRGTLTGGRPRNGRLIADVVISTPTTLVLGAGASAPYGPPTGDRLRTMILDQCRQEGGAWMESFKELGIEPGGVMEFRNTFWKSSQQSIDAFLEYRREFLEVGKTAIARALVPHEDEDRLFTEFTGAWYHYLFSALSAPPDRFAENKLSIVTFNYDRSIEQFLFVALQNTHRLSYEDAATLVGSIPIVHMYGQLGSLPWQRTRGPRPYAPDLNANALRTARDQIRLVFEGPDSDDRVARAQTLIREAEKVYFLGFSYAALNMERLAVDPVGRAVIGTALGLEQAEKVAIQQRWPIGLYDVDALTFLRRVVQL